MTPIEVLNSLHKPDFICGTESWLNSSIKNGEIFPTSFNVFRKDRETSTIGGGVFQISNEDLITSQLDNLSSTNSESIWTETQIKGINPIVICTFYRPPKDTQGFQLDELDQALSKLGNKINTQNIIIMGDFNLSNIDWGKMPLGHQHVNVPTHTRGNSNNSLDLVLTNRPDLIKKLSVVDGVADHNTILIDINISPKRKCRHKRNFFIRNKADNASILKHLDNFKDESLC